MVIKRYALITILIVTFNMSFATVNLYQTFKEVNSTIPGIVQIDMAKDAGDINGDGYSDIAIVSGDNIFIYFGANRMDTNPDISLLEKGTSLKALGDINGDGYDDISTTGSLDWQTLNWDRIQIFHGGQSTDDIPDQTIEGCLIEPWCFTHLINALNCGDLNKDGYNDIAIYKYYDRCNFHTDYSIYTGSQTELTFMSSLPSKRYYNNYTSHLTCNSDINGDGYQDLIMKVNYGGTHNCSIGLPETDSLQIIYGKINMNFIPDTSFFTTSRMGGLIAIGDINNDNKDDLAQIRTKYGFVDTIAIFPGEGILSQVPSINITEQNLEGIRRVHDINNDGFDDFLVGKRDKGSLKLFYGQTNYSNRPDTTVFQAKAGEAYKTYNRAGDVNNDGYEDIILVNSRSQQPNKASLYYGGAPMDTTADVVFDYQGRDNSFGWALSDIGDVNGDGFDDIISGAFGYYQSTGRAYVYLGNNPVDYTADLILTGKNPNDFFGIDVKGLGDLNKDGYDEYIVGAEGYQNKTGRAYVYFGGYMLADAPGLILQGENEGDYFGKSVNSAGDVNGDGYPDIIVGAKEYNSQMGRAYIYFGGTTPDSIPDVILTGGSQGISFGVDVSSCGDINKDGYDDVIIGANHVDAYQGEAYVFLGGDPMDTQPDLTLRGEATGDIFGSSVTAAGDVNGDGYDDFAVGAYQHNEHWGRVYLYFGKDTLDNTADLIMDGQFAGENFGRSLSGVGDANQDGYDDLFVGAYVNNNFTGRAYLYHGGPVMDNSPDEILTGESEYSYFGSAVSGAGDVNDDGTMDLLVGAYEYGNMDNGKVYLYEHEPAGETITYNFATEGWYLISLPVVVRNKSVQDLFPTALNGHAFYWNGYQYVTVDTMESHRGYWINIDQAISVDVTGIPIYHYIQDFEEAGWYLLGSVLDTTDLTDPADTPEDKVLTPAFGWNAATQSYEICNDLKQTQSCWVAVMEPCQLDVQSSAAQGIPKMNMALLRKKFGSTPPPPPYENKTSMSDDNNFPKTYQLYANYPNPFNPTTTIQFDCPKSQQVTMTVYNIMGQKVNTILNKRMNAGTHQITWNAKDKNGMQLPSNIYFVRMQSGNYIKTIKTILMK